MSITHPNNWCETCIQIVYIVQNQTSLDKNIDSPLVAGTRWYQDGKKEMILSISVFQILQELVEHTTMWYSNQAKSNCMCIAHSWSLLMDDSHGLSNGSM